jgi:ADP-ribose pyrophosphatase YjhB (NUDIX family)
MPTIAVNVAVIHEGKILLTRRHDFHVWCLPSGGVEEGESIAEAAIRETKEETGIEIELTRLVGMYSRLGGIPSVSAHAALFEARPIGGEIKIQPGETLEVRYFSPEELPEEMFFGHRKRIEDVFNHFQVVCVRQQSRFPAGPSLSYQELLESIRVSGMPPEKFYMQKLRTAEVEEVIEVGNDSQSGGNVP